MEHDGCSLGALRYQDLLWGALRVQDHWDQGGALAHARVLRVTTYHYYYTPSPSSYTNYFPMLQKQHMNIFLLILITNHIHPDQHPVDPYLLLIVCRIIQLIKKLNTQIDKSGMKQSGGTIINKKQKPQLQSKIRSKISEELGSSQLNNLQNNKSGMLSQTIVPKKGHQVDAYEGPVDPVTRMRHGVGTYRYPNKFFTYEGNYNQGVKEGQGCFRLADGTVINGTFVGNQLTGEAEIAYADGSKYKGSLLNGEKSGYGQYKSRLEEYQGQFCQNQRHGQGRYKNSTTTIVGKFRKNKPHGQGIQIMKYNYEYNGQCVNGLKEGKGVEVSTYTDQNYKYEGQFKGDKFGGEGLYVKNGKIGYQYEGLFKDGVPALYPNEFKLLLGTAVGSESQKPAPEAYSNIGTEQTLAAPIQYELQSQNQLYFCIESCYQGPEQLDPNQPTQQEIDKMVKDWQAENKKNKNPPPMPDFRQPRKIKPTLVVVSQESLRPIQVRLVKAENGQAMKIDYREAIKNKRAQNQVLKAQAAKKAEEEGNKKGGKGGAKGGEPQLKVNAFVANPKQKQKVLTILNEKGKVEIQRLQFPDDFPIGTYQLIFTSPFESFGQIKQIKKTINIKAKNAGGKKK